jgi:hypothetical protein
MEYLETISLLLSVNFWHRLHDAQHRKGGLAVHPDKEDQDWNEIQRSIQLTRN